MSPVEVAQTDGVISHLGVVRCLLQLTGASPRSTVSWPVSEIVIASRPPGFNPALGRARLLPTRLAVGHARSPPAGDDSFHTCGLCVAIQPEALTGSATRRPRTAAGADGDRRLRRVTRRSRAARGLAVVGACRSAGRSAPAKRGSGAVPAPGPVLEEPVDSTVPGPVLLVRRLRRSSSRNSREYEALYGNMPVFGLAAAAGHLPTAQRPTRQPRASGSWGRGGPAGLSARHGLVRDLPGPAGQRVRRVADRPIRPGTSRVDLAAATRPERRRLPSATLGEMRLEFGGLGNRGQSSSEQIISLCMAATAASPRS